MTQMLCTLLLALCPTTSAVTSDDPLFQRMIGHWHGAGKRVFFISGREVLLESETESRIESTPQGERLVSNNQWTERADGAAEPRTYTTRYWIQADPTAPGVYALGYFEDGNRPAAYGKLADDRFIVRQELGGGTPPYAIESSTVFSQGSSVYLETVWHGDTRISEATVRYTLIDPQNP